MDILGQKSKLNSDIILFTRIGAVSALIAVIPLIWALVEVLGNHAFFKENELGDFIGGTSGTFASFAGLAFVYVAFLGQRFQILMQQEELELNRQEMKDTRLEIQGQKEQLELQNKQFQIQSFENVFFHLTGLYKQKLINSFPPNGAIPQAMWVYFIQELDVQKKRLVESDIQRDALINHRKKAFENSFERVQEKIESLIKTIYGICIHTHNHRRIINEKYYQDVLYRQLEITEINILFYGFFSQTGLYKPFFEQILASFLRRMDQQKLHIPTDILFLKEIPEPDPEFGDQGFKELSNL